jgi:pimeloyl-ACP methyl ester carboxylesterase
MIRLRAGLIAGWLVLGGTVLAAQAPQAAATAPAAATLATVVDQQFTAGDVTLRYRDVGSGVPIVFIHGYSATLESMIGVSRALPDSHRKVAVDMRGFGRSTKFGEPARFGQLMVDDVVRLMDHLKIERAHLVGHSIGALIAANVAARYPARVISASLVAGPFYPDEATFRSETARWIADLESGAGLTNFLKWLLPAMKPEMAGMASAQSMKTNDLPSLIAVLKSLPALAIAGLKINGDKTVLVAGTGDPLFPLSTAFSKQTPGARIVEVANGDHVSVVTNPGAVTAMTELVRR